MKLTWPNLLSILRIGLIPIFAFSLIDKRPALAAVTFALAGLTDLLDGIIARSWKQQSTLGAYLDPAADKMLLTAAYVMLAIPGLHVGQEIPVWISVTTIARDVAIVTIAFFVYRRYHLAKFTPSWISKWNTVLQISAVSAVLLTGLSPIFNLLGTIVVGLAITTTIASALEYGWRFVYPGTIYASLEKK